MSYTFRTAIREEVGLLIGLIGPSGSGKTYSAMRLASGIVGQGNRFAVIDTESRRALHYADMFQFDHLELSAPFRPKEYAEAIQTADKGGYRAIVVDSFSHEWAGEGGILDWQEEELTRMAGDDWKKREACKMASWIQPKMGHKQMVQRLLQVKANLILCFRAEEKIKMEKDQNGKVIIVPVGFQPICSKEMPFELTVSFLLDPNKPGYPQPMKLQEQHKAIFPLEKQINEESGKLVSEWARGGIKRQDEKKQSIPSTPVELFDQYMDGLIKKQRDPETAKKMLNEYVKFLAESNSMFADQVKEASQNFKEFWNDFLSWASATTKNKNEE